MYSMLVSTSGQGSISIITFDNLTRVVKWQTDSDLDVGNYRVTIKGTINSFTQNTSFNLLVYNC
jgi:hypothetical protein